MVNINLDGVLNSIESILTNAYTKEVTKVKAIIADYITDAKERLKDVAEGAISGELSYKDVISFLQDEKLIIKDQLLSITEIVGADLQYLINQAIDIFEFTIKSAIGQN